MFRVRREVSLPFDFYVRGVAGVHLPTGDGEGGWG